MSGDMAIRSRELLQRLGIDSPFLYRWRHAGFIIPERLGERRSEGATWPDWTLRMGALLRRELTPGEHPSAQLDMLRKVAECLALFPDVPFVVIREDGLSMPAWDAAEVIALHRHAICCSTVVAIPALEDIGA